MFVKFRDSDSQLLSSTPLLRFYKCSSLLFRKTSRLLPSPVTEEISKSPPLLASLGCLCVAVRCCDLASFCEMENLIIYNFVSSGLLKTRHACPINSNLISRGVPLTPPHVTRNRAHSHVLPSPSSAFLIFYSDYRLCIESKFKV